ncbi:cystathionine beta-synthase [Naviculisporaceae sp. PSN 640]
MTDIMAQPVQTPSQFSQPFVSKWASRYRGATVEDLDPPAALSLTPSDTINTALAMAFERDYTHLTVVDGTTRALLGYISIPSLRSSLESGKHKPEDELRTAMMRFNRGSRNGGDANKYRVITMDTPLEELEAFFAGAATGGQKQDFAVITDERRRFVLGVATVEDLEEFVKRRPA